MTPVLFSKRYWSQSLYFLATSGVYQIGEDQARSWIVMAGILQESAGRF